MQKLALFLSSIFLTLTMVGQDNRKIVDLEMDMSYHADVMMNAQKTRHRVKAAEEFQLLFKQALDIEQSFSFPFDSIPWVTKLIPEDNTFRLFSWALNRGEDGFKYFAILQKADGQLIEFNDSRPLISSSERGNFSAKKWYGAIYFGIEKMAKKDSYVILGFDAHDKRTNKKIADILTIEGDEVVLGAPVFIKKDKSGIEEKSRIVTEYSDSSNGIMKFDREQDILIYDHMVTVFTTGPNSGGVPVPDGSYHAYEFKKGEWRYIDKVFNQVSEEAPRERPILGDKTKDIFGKPKKG